MNKLLQPHIQNDFLEDILLLFSNQKKGHCGLWTYSDSLFDGDKVQGAKLWNLFSRSSSDYYIYRNETKLVTDVVKSYPKLFHGFEHLIDFGPGKAAKDKTTPFLNSLLNLKSYHPVDLCDEYLQESSALSESLGVNSHSIKADFFSDILSYPDRSLGLMLGGTILNGESYDFSCRLRAIASSFKGILIIGYDANQDKDSLIKAYDHPIHALHTVNLMHRIKRDLYVTGDFSADYWAYKPIWDATNHCIDHSLICLKDHKFSIDGHVYSFKQNDPLVVDRSYKLPILKFTQIALKAGLKTKAVFTDNDNRMALHILENK